MRNLKRALSLAMASIMIIGLMVTGAAAVSNGDFSDKDKIVNKEAVSVLTTLNVINGRDDGSYDPTGVVTRGEMAKMICIILNGGRDPQLGETVNNSYTDTATHWAKAYIEFCTTRGIVAGRNNGTFDPNGSVTVAEAGKMLLVALGYNASVEGFTGANWQMNTDVTANQKGLYDGIGTSNTSTPLTRDNAAQICYNALDVRMVQYSYVITGTADNSLTTKPQINDKDKGTLLYEMFNAVKVEGTVVGNEYADMTSSKKDSDLAPGVVGTALETGKTTLIISNGEDQTSYTGTKTFNVASGLDVLGRNVSIFVKIENNVNKAQVIGSVILSDDNKVVTDYTGDKLADIADDNNLEFTSKTRVANNYASETGLSDATINATGTVGVEKILIDGDSDGKVDYVLMNTPEFGKVTKYSTADKGSMTVSLASGSFAATKSANVVGFEDVKKDDYVMAMYIGGKLHVEVAETVTGTIEAYKNNSAGTATTKLTVDGTEYTVAATGAITVTADEVYPAKDLFSKADKTALDTDATFYLNANGQIIARGQVVETAYNYAYVKAVDNVNATVDSRVRVTLPDGKTGVYNISDKSAVKLKDIAAGSVYAYSLTNDGKDIKLTAAKTTDLGGSAVFEKGKSTIAYDGKKEYATNSTVFYYVDANKNVNVYTGRNNAPSIKDSTTTAVYKNNSGTVVAVVFSGVTSKTSVGDHMFVYGVGAISSNYTLADVILNGKDELSKGVKIDAGSNVEADTLYTYTVNGDGYYELNPVTNEAFYDDGTVTHAYGSSIVLSNGEEYLMNSNTVVVDNHDKSKTPSASFNGNINTGDTVEVLVNDGKAVMVVITKLAGDTGSNIPGTYDKTVAISGSKLNVRFYVGDTQPTNAELIDMVQAQISNVKSVSVSGTTLTITYNNNATETLTVTSVPLARVNYNGKDYFVGEDETVTIADQSKSTLLNSVTANGTTTYDVTYTGYTVSGTTIERTSTVTATSNNITVVDGYKLTHGTLAVAHKNANLVGYVSGNTITVPVGTVLNVTGKAGETLSFKETTDATKVLKTLDVTGTGAELVKSYTMTAVNTTVTSALTGKNVTIAGDGTTIKPVDGKYVYTATNGDKFEITFSDDAKGVTGDVIDVTVKPMAPVTQPINLTLSATGTGSSVVGDDTIDYTKRETTQKGFQVELGTADVKVTLADDLITIVDATTAITATVDVGTTIRATSDVKYAQEGDTVTVSVTIAGTGTAGGTITIGGVTPENTTVASGASNVAAGGDDTEIVTTAGATTGTVTFTYTLSDTYVAPTFTFA